jgi:protein SCO1/2
VARRLRLVLPLLAWGLLAGCSSSSADTFSGIVLHQKYTAPATQLTDTEGRPFSLANSTTKRLTLLFFGYTHCPDECPTTMATLASAMTRLDDSDKANVQVLFVTTDPARDTGPVLRHWLDRFDPGFVGLTGDLATIKKVGTKLGVPIAKGRRLPSGGYDVVHGTQVLAIDGHHQVPVVWTLGTSAAEYAADIHQLLS